jgi:hypothetical protein
VERLHRSALLIRLAEPVPDDPVVFDDEAVAEHRRHPELHHERGGELLEGVREDDDLGEGRSSSRNGRAPGSGARPAMTSATSDIVRPCSVEQAEPVLHEDVVVGLVPRRAPQGVDAGPLGDRDPDLGNEDALEIEGHDRLAMVGRHRHSLDHTAARLEMDHSPVRVAVPTGSDERT